MQVKKDPRLLTMAQALSGRLPEVVEEIDGRKFKLRLLKPEADDWVAANTPGSTLAAMRVNSNTPTIAAALVSIDFGDGEVPVEQLFQPDGANKIEKQFYDNNPAELVNWRRGQIVEFLRNDCDKITVSRLFKAYDKMETENSTAVSEDFTKGTPSAA
jgi:hypothetical protein